MKKTNLFYVGLTIIIGCIFLIYIVIRIGEWKLERGLEFYVLFDFANGIIKDGPVMVSGVGLGKVGKIEFVNIDKISKVRLLILLEDKVKIKKNAKVYVNQAGIMGEKYIEIDPGTPDYPDIKDGDVINGQEPIKMDEVISGVVDIVKGLKATIGGFNDIFNEEKVREQIRGAVSDISGSLKDVATIISDNKSKVSESMLSLKNTIENLKKSSDNLNSIFETNKKKINGVIDDINIFSKSLPELAKNNSKINEIVDSLRNTAKSFERSASALEPELMKFSKSISASSVVINEVLTGKKKDIEAVIDNLNGVTKSLNSILKNNDVNFTKTMTSLASITAKLDKTLELANYNLDSLKNEKGLLGVLINDKEVGDDFKKITKDLKDSIEFLKHHPGIILNKTKYVSEEDYEEFQKELKEEQADKDKKLKQRKMKKKK